MVIVSSGAKVREKLVTQLLEVFKVSNLVLEKILFQDLESYSKVKTLLKKTKTQTWVNHPRRMFPFYKQIKKELFKSKQKITFQVVWSN